MRLFGFYTIVEERQCKVYMLFGKVDGPIGRAGIAFAVAEARHAASLIVNFFRTTVTSSTCGSTRQYLRSQPVNSEEGAPMGIGIWYEMFISNPVAYLFKNADPRGSLAANVGNATVRCLSNMKLADMLENRHAMSLTVRKEVSPQSEDWGYKLGSVYIRKVHFRDAGMIQQIEEKVVNRLRQVTSAIKQDGANQVSIITSTAEREAAIEFAKAAAMRPEIVGVCPGENLPRSGDLQDHVRDSGNPEHHRRQSGDHIGSPQPKIARRPHGRPGQHRRPRRHGKNAVNAKRNQDKTANAIWRMPRTSCHSLNRPKVCQRRSGRTAACYIQHRPNRNTKTGRTFGC